MQKPKRIHAPVYYPIPSDAPVMTYAEIAEVLGVSKAFANFIGQRALRKMRKAMAARGYTMADLL